MTRYILLSILLMTATLVHAQSVSEAEKHENSDVEKLEQEKVVLQQKIDSLHTRIDEIDKLLGQDPGSGDRLEVMILKYGKRKGPMIAEGRVWVGVSPEMALDSWGEPENRKKTEGSRGINETWYYPEGRYIYFENGVVSKWKN